MNAMSLKHKRNVRRWCETEGEEHWLSNVWLNKNSKLFIHWIAESNLNFSIKCASTFHNVREWIWATRRMPNLMLSSFRANERALAWNCPFLYFVRFVYDFFHLCFVCCFRFRFARGWLKWMRPKSLHIHASSTILFPFFHQMIWMSTSFSAHTVVCLTEFELLKRTLLFGIVVACLVVSIVMLVCYLRNFVLHSHSVALFFLFAVYSCNENHLRFQVQNYQL